MPRNESSIVKCNMNTKQLTNRIGSYTTIFVLNRISVMCARFFSKCNKIMLIIDNNAMRRPKGF